MNNKSYSVICFTFLFLYGLINYSYSSDAAGLPGEYLFGSAPSVRAMGMGRTYNAISSDGAGICWNPAGTIFLNRSELSVSYATLVGGTRNVFLGYAYPFWGDNVFGVSRMSLEVDGIEKTDTFGQHQGNFSVSDSAYYMTYARRLTPKLVLGTNLKLVFQNIDIYSNQGYGIDIGVIYQINSNIYFGGSIQNLIPPTLKIKNTSESFPLGIKTGIAWKQEIKRDSIVVSADLNFPNLFPVSNNFKDGKTYFPVRWYLGTEYNFRNILSLRGGVNYKEITTGIGLAMKSIVFDYALTFQAIDVFHQFGLTYRFGLTKEEETEFRKAQKFLEIERRYEKAMELFGKQDYTGAIQESNSVLELDPENNKTQNLLKKIEIINKETKAKKLYLEALDDLLQGKDSNGKKKLAEALNLAPEQGKLLETEIYQKALNCQTVGDFAASRKELINVLNLNPDNLDAREMLKRIEVILQLNPE